MRTEGGETFTDLTERPEAIAANVLSAKLTLLEEAGIILTPKRPGNPTASRCLLTDKGLALPPILAALAAQSSHERHSSPKGHIARQAPLFPSKKCL